MMRLLALLASIVALALAGCPGSLEDPDRFGMGGGVDGGGGACDVEEIFMESCGAVGCHGAMTPAAGLDLVSADAATRLLDATASVTCEGRVQIDSTNPMNSLVLEKVAEETPSCGNRMPLLAPALSAAQIACIEQWVMEAAGGGGGGSDGGGTMDVDGGM